MQPEAHTPDALVFHVCTVQPSYTLSKAPAVVVSMQHMTLTFARNVVSVSDCSCCTALQKGVQIKLCFKSNTTVIEVSLML